MLFALSTVHAISVAIIIFRELFEKGPFGVSRNCNVIAHGRLRYHGEMMFVTKSKERYLTRTYARQ